MKNWDARAGRLLAAMQARESEIRRRLDLKDRTQSHNLNHGFVYLIRGTERVELEQELARIENWIALLRHEAS